MSVDNARCSLQIGSFAFFKSDRLEFYWIDPDPDVKDPIKFPPPDKEWRYYYEPALALTLEPVAPSLESAVQAADVKVEVHPGVLELLRQEQWAEARESALQMPDELRGGGFKPDGLKVIAGDSWARRDRHAT